MVYKKNKRNIVLAKEGGDDNNDDDAKQKVQSYQSFFCSSLCYTLRKKSLNESKTSTEEFFITVLQFWHIDRESLFPFDSRNKIKKMETKRRKEGCVCVCVCVCVCAGLSFICCPRMRHHPLVGLFLVQTSHPGSLRFSFFPLWEEEGCLPP